LGCWISPCYGPFLLGTHFETCGLFISLMFKFFPGFGEPWVAETGNTEPLDMGAHLYFEWTNAKYFHYSSIAMFNS
jgi:hypothetical protein